MSEAQTQRPHELLWMLWFDEKSISIVDISNIKILQNETVSTLNALTIYIISCMLFIASAMIQYGMLLYISRLRLKSKVNTEKSEMDEKWDRKMLVMYVIILILFNLIYFMVYLF